MHDRRNSIKARVNAANAFASMVWPIIIELREAGATLQQIADHLTDIGIMTARDCAWTPSAVRRILERHLPGHMVKAA